MIPSVPAPKGAKVLRPVEIKLKPGWRFDAQRGRFVTDQGQEFAPDKGLPKGTRIVLKVPDLARARSTSLSKPERELLRHMQVILPAQVVAADHVKPIAAWPCVEEARMAPEVALP